MTHISANAQDVTELVEALKPFAVEADAQERVTSFSSGDCVILRTRITIGELRRARAALATSSPDAAGSGGEAREAIAAAIKATEYKYFGDYEMSDGQREAVDTLVEVARNHLRSSQPSVWDLLQDARRQLEYLDGRYPTTQTPAIIARINTVPQYSPTLPDATRTREAEATERYRHVKRGTVYDVVGRAELQVNNIALTDGVTMVVYRGEDGKLWARGEAEFRDGRFELVAPSDDTSGAGVA